MELTLGEAIVYVGIILGSIMAWYQIKVNKVLEHK